MVRKVLALQNARCETLGTFDGLLRSSQYETEVVDAAVENNLPDPTNYDAVIVLGGPVSVYDGAPAVQSQIRLIMQAMGLEIPTLGVCLGSQLIAQAAGGRVYKGTRKEIGWSLVHATQDGRNGPFAGLEDPLWVFQWHGDTYQLPPSARLLAYSDLYPQAFQVGSALGVQFHVEVDPGMVRSWIAEYRSEVASEGLRPDAIMGDERMFHKMPTISATILNYFLRMVKQSSVR